MFEVRLLKAKVVTFGFHDGFSGKLQIIRPPAFYETMDWQIHRQIGLEGFWSIQRITEDDLSRFANNEQFCRQIDLRDTDVGIGLMSTRDFVAYLDLFLSPAKLAGEAISTYDRWADAISTATNDIHLETIIRLNVGVCTERELEAYKAGLWLGTKDIDLEIRPRIFSS